ncbi:GT-D fold domain-containing glycosyltransferase [Paenibacillus sacheonensis]|uniref:GT-D fold-like domain-containing protein n=1 Tax=Paenibacillus sacheonensis TaxID=742054 RepID=A0A7X5BYL5_9BACL|nr:GT-D fold domain-containing glycosyltransferase [Paenibacillus sacheonensis]MBM7566720.1 hypothetical protein [Paenibacillus sacheonensis]NBC71703.1 hypothetical protein [Paenibacillus sacheonensis]
MSNRSKAAVAARALPAAPSAAGAGRSTSVNRAKAVQKRSAASAGTGTAPPTGRTAASPGAAAAPARSSGGTVKSRQGSGKKRTRARKGKAPKRRYRGRKLRVQPAEGTSDLQQAVVEPQEVTDLGVRPKDAGQEHAAAVSYQLGLYEGGELLLEQETPANLLLPEISLREIIARGAEQIRAQCIPLMDVQEVFMEMEAAIAEQRPCAVVRLGDGELLTLAQGVMYDEGTIQREGEFLPYAGVNPPDLRARDQLAQAVRLAHIVGVPSSRRKHFQPLLHPVFRSHHLEMSQLRLTNSAVNYHFHQAGLLYRLLTGKRILVIGNVAPALSQTLMRCGFQVNGIISPVKGVNDVDRVMGEVRGVDFNLALVSAGIAAVILCTRIARELGKTALDFGHMADGIVRGKYIL